MRKPCARLPWMPDPSDFGLIETLLWTRADGFHLLEEHLARLAASSAALGFPYDEARMRAALTDARDTHLRAEAAAAREAALEPTQNLRLRLVLSRDGAVATGAAEIDPIPPGTVWRVTLAGTRLDSRDPLLRHKTTRRALYEDALAAAQQGAGADEVLFLNERGEVCEAARCNLFLPRDGVLLTPPLSSGVLAGTLRAHLLRAGRAREEILQMRDLEGAFLLGNSVRGLVSATMSRPSQPLS